jgi:hypothetical protein
MLGDAHFYADGHDTTQIESIHHVRRQYLSDRNRYHTRISGRVVQADLHWNEGWLYEVDVLERQGHGLSVLAIQQLKAIIALLENRRVHNQTEARRCYLCRRKEENKKRSLLKQPIDIYAYVGRGERKMAETVKCT